MIKKNRGKSPPEKLYFIGILGIIIISVLYAAIASAILNANLKISGDAVYKVSELYFLKIVNGQYFGIALASDGSVWTWGYNNVGQRGLGHTSSGSAYRTPTQIPQNYFGKKPIIDIATGYASAFALNSEGKIYAWGDGTAYQLGTNSTSNQSTPLLITMPQGITFTQISAFYQTGGAIGSDGNIYTWGLSTYGATGNGNTTNKAIPSAITSSGDFVKVSQGTYGGAAINKNGEVYVWGNNLDGTLGNGSMTGYNNIPKLVPNLTNIKDISYGTRHILAINTEGYVYGWGSNANGRLGLSGANITTPTIIPNISNASMVNAAFDFSQIKVGNNIYSMGNANFGELFAGNTLARPTPHLSTLANVYENVGYIAGRFDNAYILSADLKTVYGIGYCDAAGQEFGSATIQSTSTSNVVPWSFTDPNWMK